MCAGAIAGGLVGGASYLADTIGTKEGPSWGGFLSSAAGGAAVGAAATSPVGIAALAGSTEAIAALAAIGGTANVITNELVAASDGDGERYGDTVESTAAVMAQDFVVGAVDTYFGAKIGAKVAPQIEKAIVGATTKGGGTPAAKEAVIGAAPAAAEATTDFLYGKASSLVQSWFGTPETKPDPAYSKPTKPPK